MRKSFLLLALLPFVLCMRANAGTSICVNSAASLQAALNTSQADGADNYIYIVAGYYSLSAGLTFFSNENHKLYLLGGFDSSCNLRVGRTTLDGQNLVRPLYVATATGSLLVERINFERGYSPEGAGGGLYFSSGSGDASILLNRFRFNRSLSYGGAMYVNSDTGNVLVYNNLVYANRANQVGGVMLDLGEYGRVLNNTIVSNITDTPTVPGGMLVYGSGTVDLSNNILWDNAPASGADFRADMANSRRHNDIEIVAGGVPPDVLIGEQSVDPQFVQCGFLCVSFDLLRASPLVDAGLDAAVGYMGGPSAVDLRELPRIIGPHVDIGAYENDKLLADGFDP